MIMTKILITAIVTLLEEEEKKREESNYYVKKKKKKTSKGKQACDDCFFCSVCYFAVSQGMYFKVVSSDKHTDYSNSAYSMEIRVDDIAAVVVVVVETAVAVVWSLAGGGGDIECVEVNSYVKTH